MFHHRVPVPRASFRKDVDAAGECDDAREAELQGHAKADVLEFCDEHSVRVGACNDDLDRVILAHYGSDDVVQGPDYWRMALARFYGYWYRHRCDLDEEALEALAFRCDFFSCLHHGDGRDFRGLAVTI
jgi:hypothetical protein